jgi:uncharacterized protein (DUF1697 family)
MNTYIAILRGINVGAQKAVKMEELRKMFEKLGAKRVKTYIQSGNVVFDSTEKNCKELKDQIEKEIGTTFGFDVPTLVIELSELKGIIKNNPYPAKKDVDISKVHVTFLSDQPDDELIAKIDQKLYKPDEFTIGSKSIYLHIPESYGLTKLSNSFFEKKLKLTATTRNWKTTNELLTIAENSER